MGEVTFAGIRAVFRKDIGDGREIRSSGGGKPVQGTDEGLVFLGKVSLVGR